MKQYDFIMFSAPQLLLSQMFPPLIMCSVKPNSKQTKSINFALIQNKNPD